MNFRVVSRDFFFVSSVGFHFHYFFPVVLHSMYNFLLNSHLVVILLTKLTNYVNKNFWVSSTILEFIFLLIF